MKIGKFIKQINGKDIDEYVIWCKNIKSLGLFVIHSKSVGYAFMTYIGSGCHVRFWRLKILIS